MFEKLLLRVQEYESSPDGKIYYPFSAIEALWESPKH